MYYELGFFIDVFCTNISEKNCDTVVDLSKHVSKYLNMVSLFCFYFFTSKDFFFTHFSSQKDLRRRISCHFSTPTQFSTQLCHFSSQTDFRRPHRLLSTQLSCFWPKLNSKANHFLDQSLSGHRSRLDTLREP